MAVGESEKNRKLSEAEQRRLQGFEQFGHGITPHGFSFFLCFDGKGPAGLLLPALVN